MALKRRTVAGCLLALLAGCLLHGQALGATVTSPSPAAVTSPATVTSPSPAAVTSPSPAAVTSPSPAAVTSPSPAAVTSPAVASPSPVATSAPKVTPAATPAATPLPTVGAPPSPPPSPPTAFTSTALKTALAAKFRLIGPGVTPFDTNKQKILLYAVGYTIANVDFDKLRITNVQGVASFRRRSLLASTYLSNVADVTMEMNTASESAVSGVNTSVVEAVDGGTLATALQAQGESAWGITLVNTSQVKPGATVPGATCKNVFGPWCLDNTHLTPAGVKGIIAGGIIFLITLTTLLLIVRDIRERSGKVGEIAPDTPGKEPLPAATPKAATAAAPTQITASAGPAAPVAGAKAVKK